MQRKDASFTAPGNWLSVADSAWLWWVAWSWTNALHRLHGLTAMRTNDNLLVLHAILVWGMRLDQRISGVAKQSFG